MNILPLLALVNGWEFIVASAVIAAIWLLLGRKPGADSGGTITAGVATPVKPAPPNVDFGFPGQLGNQMKRNEAE